MKKLEVILKKAVQENTLNKEEIIELLQLKGADLNKLYTTADRIRAEYHGNEVHLRGLIEFSNYCIQNCHYCGLRKDNRQLTRYRLEAEQIIELAEQAGELGYKTIVLQSGEDDYYDRELITHIISEIKAKVDTAITLSLGEKNYKDYKIWRDAGADRYLLRHETADPELYDRLHPGRNLDSRIRCLKQLKELGYQVGSGNLLGLPGQTTESIARDIQLFKRLDLEMVGVGPLITHLRTPLADNENGTLELSLKVIALSRLLLPRAHIPATTALGTIHPEGRQKGLQVGANVVMPNVTSGRFRSLYQLYPDKICVQEEAANCRKCIGGIIASLGRSVAEGYGHYNEATVMT